MSFQCRIVYTPLFLRTLQRMTISRDPWVTMILRKELVLLHAATDDQSVTATATVPLEVFSDYTLTLTTDDGTVLPNLRIMINAAVLIDALTLNGGGGVAISSTGLASPTKVVLNYPTHDGRLQVQLQDEDRVMQSCLLVKDSKEHLLDLHFKAAASPNLVVARGEVLKECINAISGMHCDHIGLKFSRDGVVFNGTNSPHGEASMEMDAKGDAILTLECGDDTVHGKYLATHLSLAVGSGSGSKGRPAMHHHHGGGGGDGHHGGFGGFTKVLLRVNTERQLCVTHQGLDHEPPVQVNIVVSPLAPSLDDII